VKKPNRWFLETRPQFLILSVILAFLGTAIAWYSGNGNGNVNIWQAILAGIGLILTHASVNILNDYFDFRSGIDQAAKRTPFSGGSGILPANLLTPRQVLWMGIVCFTLAVPIGIYFIFITNWQLLPLLIFAAFFIILYSPLILKHPWPEWAAGVGLGALPILGMYFVQTSAFRFDAWIGCVPSALLVHNLLLLNEFPDVEADKIAHRATLPISMGVNKAAVIYSMANIATYVWIVIWVAAGFFGWTSTWVMPPWTLLALLTLPLAIRGIKGAFNSNDPARLMPGMAANVMNVLLTQLLLGVGYILGRVIQ
jgi:1,4-dihydroxy-2-naphthoate polyprenyltransferase